MFLVMGTLRFSSVIASFPFGRADLGDLFFIIHKSETETFTNLLQSPSKLDLHANEIRAKQSHENIH